MVSSCGAWRHAQAGTSTPDIVVCVTDAPTGPDPMCWGTPCDEVHAEVSAALQAAGVLVGAAEATPRVRICMGAELPDSGTPYEDSLIVDNRGGVFGDPLELVLRRPICPDPGSGPSQPLLEIVADGEVELVGPVTDMATCSAGSRPGVSVWGGGHFNVYGLSIGGWTGYGVANGAAGLPGSLDLGRGAIVNGTGVAVQTWGFIDVTTLEIAGNRTGGAPALVWASGHVRVADSVLYGNLVDEGPSVALVSGQALTASNSAFIANGVVGSKPLLHTTLERAYFPNREVPVWGLGFENVVFARNAWVSTADSVDLHVTPSAFGELGESACAAEPASPYWNRPHPFAGLPTGPVAPVIRALPTPAETAIDGVLRIARCQFLENRSGVGAALVEVESLRSGEWIALTNDTFAGNDGATVAVSVQGGQGGVALLRNLFVDGAGTFSAVDFVEPPGSLVLSMNAAPEGLRWTPGVEDVPHVIVGPTISFAEASFEPAQALRALTPCDRHLAVCPDASEGDCSAPDGGYMECAPDVAAAYVPSEVFAAEIGAPWPWDTDYFDGLDVSVAGATGWRCGDLRGTLDLWHDIGDGDGFPDAVDCDNEDPDVVPALPEHDGYSSPWCDATEVDCYTCPPGSSPPPDDDDSGIDDDDISGHEGPGRFASVEGCDGTSGCGFSWTCQGGGAEVGLLVPPLLAVLASRRSPGRRGGGRTRRCGGLRDSRG